MLQKFGLNNYLAKFRPSVTGKAQGNQIVWMIGLFIITVELSKRLNVMDIMSASLLLFAAVLAGVIVALPDLIRDVFPIEAIGRLPERSALPSVMITPPIMGVSALLRTIMPISTRCCFKRFTTIAAFSGNALAAVKIGAFSRAMYSTVLSITQHHFKLFVTHWTNRCNSPLTGGIAAFNAAIIMRFFFSWSNRNSLTAIGATAIWLLPARFFSTFLAAIITFSYIARPNINGLTTLNTGNSNAGHVASPVMRPEFGVGGWSGNQPCQRLITPFKPIQIIP